MRGDDTAERAFTRFVKETEPRLSYALAAAYGAEVGWNYEGDFWPVKEAGQNLFVEGTDTGYWTGGLEGTTEEEFVGVFHQNHANYRGDMEFAGFVGGVYGTVTIKTEGILKDGIWTGSRVIQHGTGDLAGVHGGGTFVGSPLFLDYEGKIHFSA